MDGRKRDEMVYGMVIKVVFRISESFYFVFEISNVDIVFKVSNILGIMLLVLKYFLGGFWDFLEF